MTNNKIHIEMTASFEKSILKESKINIILIGEKGAGKTEFLRILLGKKIKENVRRTIHLIKKNSLYFFDTTDFKINEPDKALSIHSDVINLFEIIAKIKGNKRNYLVLFFIKNEIILLKQIKGRDFIFVLSQYAYL